MKIKHFGFLLIIIALINGCVINRSISPAKRFHNISPVNQMLNEFGLQSLTFNPVRATLMQVDGYNDQFTPAISPSNTQEYLNFQRSFLAYANNIDRLKLSTQDLITLRVFIHDRKMAINASEFPEHLIPLNQLYSEHNIFAQLGSGLSVQPFNKEQDYRNFLKRAEGFSIWMDSAILAMQEGIEKNIVQPRVIVEKILPQLQAHLVDDLTQSIFYAPLKHLPASIGNSDRIRLVKDYLAGIKNVIIPAYQRMYNFLSTDYLSHSRQSVGLAALDNGTNWYKFAIKTHTTLSLSAEEIHQFGLTEVNRILHEMQQVKEAVKFSGSLPEFFEYLRHDDQFYFASESELLQAYTDIKYKIGTKLPQLFEVFPKADYEVHAVPEYRAASAPGASYQSPAPDGSRPGVFYINTHDLKSQPKFIKETLSIHEAVPGHHFQIAIQQELDYLPDYRKFGGYTVYAEGWALYAESLGKELGLFTDPYMWYGKLVDEQLRAMRLVVDTGMHAMNWSRQQAINYMQENSSMSLMDIEAEVDRYIVIPAQALSYKIGQRKISDLRAAAERQLGNKFNIRKFHTQVLKNGSVPMPILEESINNWIELLR